MADSEAALGALEFSRLASGLACAIKAEKAMSGARLGAPGDATAKAWETLTDPDFIALLALGHPAPRYASMAMAVKSDPLPGWSDEQALAVAAGLDEVASELEKVGSSPQFLEAARAYAPMVASAASPKQVMYPWMRWSARLGTTSTGGKKREGFSGVQIAQADAGDALYEQSNPERLKHYMDRLSSSSLPLSEQEAQALDELARGAEAFGRAVETRGRHDRVAISPGLEAVMAGAGTSDLVGDHPLPSVSAFEQAAKAAQKRGADKPWFALDVSDVVLPTRDSNSTLFGKVEEVSKAAVGRAWAAAMSTMSSALEPAPLDAGLPGRRDAKMGFWAGPLAQALPRHYEAEHVAPASDFVRALTAALGEDYRQDRHRGDGSDVARLAADLRARGGDVKAALAKGAADLKKRHARAKKEEQERGSRPRRSHVYEGDPIPAPDFGARGEGLLGLSNALRSSNPRVGLIQWSARALQALKEIHGLQGFDQALRQAQPSRQALIGALGRLGAALREARVSFASEVAEAAKPLELAWADASGQGQAWRQAQASGSLTQKSILWAKENPLDASVSASDDPLARLAGKASRALGIRSGDPAEMSAGLRAELGERGLDEAGWKILGESEPARELLTQLFGEMSGQRGKSTARAASVALSGACKALSAAGAAGLSGVDAGMLAGAIARDVPGHLGEKAREDAIAGWDERALGSSWRSSWVSSAEEALSLAARAVAAQTGQKHLYAGLAKDWMDALDAAARQGVDLDVARQAQMERTMGFAQAMPQSGSIDWASDPFAGRPIWELFGAQSPRLRAAIEASKKEGPLGEWVAEAAVAFKIKDAADPNDLAGQCKARAKDFFSLGEGAWKALIKQSEGLRLMRQGIEPLTRHHGWGHPRREWKLQEGAWSAGDGERSRERDDGRLGLALNSAVSQGIDAATALAAFEALKENRSSSLLFSPTIDQREVDGAEAARFYAAECQAKSSRMPKIFKEACSRFGSLAQKYEKAKAAGLDALAPKQALAEEARDLCDWIKGSEYGLWQTLPEQPTWGQLQRLSGAWHDEMAAREADRQARQKAEVEEQKAQRRLAPFAPTSAEHWEAVLGKFERDGWEAVEMTSQAELSEEGREMSHCVSGYSGYCRSGELRIFSIRLNGERRCTMELRASSGASLGKLGEVADFKITQNKGKHNAHVSNQATLKFCAETVAAAEASWSAKWRATQALIKAEEDKRKAKEKQAREAKKSTAQGSAEGGQPTDQSIQEQACAKPRTSKRR